MGPCKVLLVDEVMKKENEVQVPFDVGEDGLDVARLGTLTD